MTAFPSQVLADWDTPALPLFFSLAQSTQKPSILPVLADGRTIDALLLLADALAADEQPSRQVVPGADTA